MAKVSRREAGFTLLEVIIAFTIIALMAGIVFSALRLSMNSYERSQVRLEEKATERFLFDQIKRQIGSLLPVRPTGGFAMLDEPMPVLQNPMNQVTQAQSLLFYGDSESVTFVSVAPLFLIQHPGMTVVRYGRAQDEFGRDYLGVMEAAYTGQFSFMDMAGSPQGTPYPLVEGIDRLEFEFYGFDAQTQQYAWFDRWDGQEMMNVPRAIKIAFDEEYLLVPINADGFGQGLGGFNRGAATGVMPIIAGDD